MSHVIGHALWHEEEQPGEGDYAGADAGEDQSAHLRELRQCFRTAARFCFAPILSLIKNRRKVSTEKILWRRVLGMNKIVHFSCSAVDSDQSNDAPQKVWLRSTHNFKIAVTTTFPKVLEVSRAVHEKYCLVLHIWPTIIATVKNQQEASHMILNIISLRI